MSICEKSIAVSDGNNEIPNGVLII
jgi:hypothetical protein